MELEDGLNQFAYIFIRSFEEKLKYWQRYLEDCSDPRSTSKAGIAVATAALVIPQVGKGISSVVRKGDDYIQGHREKNTAESMAEVTYFFDNNKDSFRLILIEGALDVFHRYEHQFSLVTCKGGRLRAMQKLGSDASHRIISFLLEDRSIRNLTPELVAKGIVLGKSSWNSKKIVKNGRTLLVEEEILSTDDFFTNTGVRTENNGVISYYRHKDCLKFLRHRLMFLWEDEPSINSKYEIDRPEYSYKYRLIFADKHEQIEAVRKFVTTKNPVEDIKEFVRVKDDELESLIKEGTDELKQIHSTNASENIEHHNMTREFVINSREWIVTYLNDMLIETIKRSLDEDRLKREEYDRTRREEEDRRRKEEEERRRLKEEEERRVREEEEHRRKEETEMILAKVHEQGEQRQLPESAIIIDGAKIKSELKKVEDMMERPKKVLKEELPDVIGKEAKRLEERIKKIRIKW